MKRGITERNVINEGEQLVKKYKDEIDVRHSLKQLKEMMEENEAKTGDERQIIDKWKHLMKEYTETEVKDVKTIIAKKENKLKTHIEKRVAKDIPTMNPNVLSVQEALHRLISNVQRWNVMNHLSKIVGVYVGRSITDHFGDKSNEMAPTDGRILRCNLEEKMK